MNEIVETCSCGASISVPCDGSKTVVPPDNYGRNGRTRTEGIDHDQAVEIVREWRREHRHTPTDTPNELADLLAEPKSLLVYVREDEASLLAAANRIALASAAAEPEAKEEP